MKKSEKLSDYLDDIVGVVYNVDTRKVIVNVEDEANLNILKINDIMIFSGSNADEKLIGIVTKVSKKRLELDKNNEDEEEYSENYCMVVLVGTFFNKLGTKKRNVFKRAINSYPEINSEVYKANEKALYIIMNALANVSRTKDKLVIGKFASNKDVQAILDGNKFFQRHACIVGSTGSGKSYTVANILEKVNNLKYANVIVFDLHGEYNELSYAEQIKIGSEKNELQIPLWFFNYEEIHSLFIESSEGSSSNQRAAVIEYILKSKYDYIKNNMKELNPEIVTADIPIPFSVKGLKENLEYKNKEEIDTGEVYKSGSKEGQAKTKQGQYFDKLTNLITRLQTKMDDKKYSFVFNEKETDSHKYLNIFAEKIMGGLGDKKVKIIDLSEIPSDILPIIIGIITRIVYDIQFWMTPSKKEVRHPLSIICDEAHIYMPNDTSKLKAVEKRSLEIFEKIAKEGRKYGVGLVIVSQRPSELNTTIVSQCNNIISLKVTNDRDKASVSAMLTDSLTGLTDLLPNLDVGECIVVGDSIMLPSKIILDSPKEPPKSSTIDFWDRWNDNKNTVYSIDDAIVNMIQQHR